MCCRPLLVPTHFWASMIYYLLIIFTLVAALAGCDSLRPVH
jgi:hypothetical protein